MSYDIGKGGRETMVKYAMQNCVAPDRGLHAGEFQVALATSFAHELHTHAEIKAELEAVHRQYRVGYCHWSFDAVTRASDFSLHNNALNPDGPSVGTLGHPLQYPLGQRRIDAFTVSGASSSSS